MQSSGTSPEIVKCAEFTRRRGNGGVSSMKKIAIKLFDPLLGLFVPLLSSHSRRRKVFGLVTKEAEEAIWQKCREALFAFARIAYSLLLPQRQWKRVLRVSQIWSHPGVRDTEAVAGSMTRQLRQACALLLSHFNFLFSCSLISPLFNYVKSFSCATSAFLCRDVSQLRHCYACAINLT